MVAIDIPAGIATAKITGIAIAIAIPGRQGNVAPQQLDASAQTPRPHLF
jgi:hypothetical protein